MTVPIWLFVVCLASILFTALFLLLNSINEPDVYVDPYYGRLRKVPRLQELMCTGCIGSSRACPSIEERADVCITEDIIWIKA